MKKQITILIIQIFFCVVCFAQKEKIDSLKKVLPGLRNSDRIECLTNISCEFILADRKDSAIYYATVASNEAKITNDAHDIAISLVTQSQIVLYFNNDFTKIESLVKEAFSWFSKTSNKNGILPAYDLLWVATFAQSRYTEAANYLQEKLNYCEEIKNDQGIWESMFFLGITYKEAGDYEKSFHYFHSTYQLALQSNNKMNLVGPLFGIGDLYLRIEDYMSALPYYRQGFQLKNQYWPYQDSKDDIWAKMQFAEVFTHLNQFDSAWHYYKLFKPSDDDHYLSRAYLASTGECLLQQKNYKPALQSFEKSLSYNLKMNDRNQIMRILLDIAKIYNALQNDTSALRYAKEGLNIALQTKTRQFVRDGYEIIYLVYDRKQQADSANLYFRKFTAMKDSVANDQLKIKLTAYTYDQKIAFLNKEKEIQQSKLEKASTLKKIFIVGAICLLSLGFFVFRNIILKRRNEKQRLEHELELQQVESEKTKAEFQQQATELEMQALRAQMNPHFIFNSLNSINRFILQNNKAQASEYLTKFSRLVRLILQNSQSALIPLESELESLQLYLELEAVRFDNHFNFKITVENDLDISVIQVPPLIIQPYTENAIWHGLMHKEEKGHLEIELFQKNDVLYCKITDDGIGRKKAPALKSKSASTHKSMGMQITASRIEMLQQKKQLDAHIKITDLVLADGSAGGTEVLLKIPIMK